MGLYDDILDQSLAWDLRHAMEADALAGRSLYQLAKDSGVAYQVLHRFRSGEREHLRSDVMGRLCVALRLRLQPEKKS